MEPVEHKIQEYSKVEAGLAEIKQKYKDVVFDVTTKDGMTQAKTARAELRNMRLNLEDIRKKIKEPVLLLSRRIDEEAKRIANEIVPMENSFDSAIKTEENRVEQEKLAKIREAQRLEDERKRKEKEEEDRKLAEERRKIDEEKAALKKEQEEIQRQKAELIAEQERILIESRKAQEEKEKQENEAKEAMLRKEREEEKRKLDEAEAKRKSELREKEEALRLAQLERDKLLDARSLLETFSAKYGSIEEFKTINNEIQKYFSTRSQGAVA